MSSSASILSPFKREKFILKTKIPSKKPQIIVGNHHRDIQYPAEDLVENRTDYASYMWLNCAINVKNCSKHKINSDFFFSVKVCGSMFTHSRLQLNDLLYDLMSFSCHSHKRDPLNDLPANEGNTCPGWRLARPGKPNLPRYAGAITSATVTHTWNPENIHGGTQPRGCDQICKNTSFKIH